MKEEIQKRTKNIGIQIIKLVDNLPNKSSSWILGKQLLRSGSSIGANYRAACRAKSEADFINKLKIVEEEADETIYWLELFDEINEVENKDIACIKKEVTEILSIVVSSIKTMRGKLVNK